MWSTVTIGIYFGAVAVNLVMAAGPIDLTFDLLSDKMPMLPNNSYHLNIFKPVAMPKQIENMTTTTAVGTHVQAPCRYQPKQWCISDIPPTKLTGPVLFIDIPIQNPDSPITAKLLRDYDVKKGSIVLIKTGWGSNWSNITKYVGTNSTANLTNMHFPGLSQDAGDLLANKKIIALGIDTLSVDYGQSNGSFPVHIALAKKNIYTVLNVNMTNLNKNNMKTRVAYVMPMKVEGAGAAPCRIFLI